MQVRTQIYLEPSQHAALLKESRRRRLSLAGMIRELVEVHLLGRGKDSASQRQRRKAALSLIGLGRSGLSDVSEKTDEHLGRALYQELVKEGRPPYRRSVKKGKRRRR